MKLRDGFQRVDAKKKVVLLSTRFWLTLNFIFKTSKLTSSIRVHHYSDEDLPESPESSPDEDFGSKTEK